MIQLERSQRVKTKPGSLWRGARLDLWLTDERGAKGPTEWKIVASRRTSRLATERNRWKRRVRAVLREFKDSIRPGYSARLRILQGASEVSHTELKTEVVGLLKESGLWRL